MSLGEREAERSPGRTRSEPDRFLIAALLLLAFFSVGIVTTLLGLGSEGLDRLVVVAQELKHALRAEPLLSTAGYFALVGGVMLMAVPLGNPMLFLAAFVLGMPLALGAHMLALFLIVPVHYGIAGMGPAARVQRLAQQVIAQTHSRAMAAVFAAARHDGIASAVTLRLGLPAPNAVTNVVCCLLGIRLRHYLTALALVGWMRPALLAYFGASATAIVSADDVTSELVRAASLALPLFVLPVLVGAWLMRRHFGRTPV